MYYVNSIIGNDNFKGGERDPFKNLDHAVKIAPSGSTLIIHPGTYRPLGISSSKAILEMCFSGLGSNTILEYFIVSGMFDCIFEKIKLGTGKFTCTNSTFRFIKTYHQGYKDFILTSGSIKDLISSELSDSLNESPESIKHEGDANLFFTKSTFNQKFQIIVQDGVYNITFNECIFKGDAPIVVVQKGEVNIKILNCTSDHHLIHNYKGIVQIASTNSIFPNYENLKVFSNSSPQIPKNALKKAIIIDSEQNDYFTIDSTTEFILINGTKNISLILPTGIDNGHFVEILKNDIDVTILGKKYCQKYLRVRYVIDTWIIY
jgi:hypothetical protein